MFQRFHALKERNERGFTLIELLVVILIIAILAAIAIPAFLRQREKGWVSQSTSALKNAATAAESYATGTGGDYTGMTLTNLEDNGFNETADVDLTVVNANTDDDEFCLQAVHDPVTETWRYDSDNGEPATAACTTNP